MGEFLNQLFTAGSIVQLAVLAGIIASVSFGVVGTYVVARRISYIAAAIAHSVLGGIGLAVWLQHRLQWEWFHPTLGAVIAAIGSALVIGWVSLHWKEREDTIISAVWSVGMSTGFLFLYFTPGFKGNLESFLLGNILYISTSDVWIMLLLGAIVVGLSVFFYNPLMAVCFDDEFAQLRGVNVTAFFFMLLIVTGLSVVLLVQLAGIILAIALIVLPAATGLQVTKKLWHAMVGAVGLAMLFTSGGIGLSYVRELPAGPSIILLAAAGYFGVLIWKKFSRP
ncbi:MAG: metal ABC transporter permease [Verrucomicrobiota bacterium]